MENKKILNDKTLEKVNGGMIAGLEEISGPVSAAVRANPDIYYSPDGDALPDYETYRFQ